jgi:hypothetical protein
MTPLRRYDTAEDGDLEFERLWPPLKGISILKKLLRQIELPEHLRKVNGGYARKKLEIIGK